MKDFILDVCAHRGISAPTASCIEMAHQFLKSDFLTIYSTGDAWLDRLRSVAATKFLKNDWAPYMIFLDDDIVFQPQDLERLLNDLRSGYELVGGCYPVRTGEQLASFGKGDGKIMLDGSIQEIQWLATGFMGFTRKLLQDMVDKLKLPLLHKGEWCECYPFFIFTYDTSKQMLFSEDWEFCRKAKRIGVKTYIDTQIQLGHIGDRVCTVKDAVVASQRRTAITKVRDEGYYKPKDSKVALESFTGVLEKMGIRYWIDYGTLLGLYRDKAFLKHDHDIDISVFADEFPESRMGEFAGLLYENGCRNLIPNEGERKQLELMHDNGVHIDFKFAEHDNSVVWDYVWRGLGRDGEKPHVVVHPIRFYKEFTEVEFEGRKYLAPSPIEGYLENQYGKNWKEPTDEWDYIKAPTVMTEDKLVELGAKFRPIAELSEYLGREVTPDELTTSSKKLADAWNNWSGKPIDFYRDDELYLYSLAEWNSKYPYRLWMTKAMAEYEGSVLDIGCGSGEFALKYAEKGRKVYGYEINKRLLDYCNFRKDKRNLDNLTFSDELPDDCSQYDNVVAMNTLEHIDDLKQFIAMLAPRLKKGCTLYHYDTFDKSEGKWPMHYEYKTEEVNGWLKKAGFKVVEDSKAIKN